MFISFKRAVILCLLFFSSVLPASSLGCILPENFQSLSESITQKYISEIPNPVSEVIPLNDNNILFEVFKKGQPGTETLYQYIFDTNIGAAGFSDGDLLVRASYRGSSSVSGRWAMYLDYKELRGAIRRLEIDLEIFPDLTNVRYLPDTITHETVTNAYLEPKILSHLEDFGTLGESGDLFAEVMSSDPFFAELTDHIPPDQAEAMGFGGHNGSQTKGFLDLMNMDLSSVKVDIDKIKLVQSEEDINMIFYLEQTPLN